MEPHLAKLLLEKGYNVTGGQRKMKKKSMASKKLNIENDINFVHFDLLDESKINKEIRLGKYNEIYNLAAQSYVDKSFKNPIYTSDINALV